VTIRQVVEKDRIASLMRSFLLADLLYCPICPGSYVFRLDPARYPNFLEEPFQTSTAFLSMARYRFVMVILHPENYRLKHSDL
jgi:hypothetical protein